MAPILLLAPKLGLTVMADAAQVIGVTYDGRPTATFRDLARTLG